MPGKLKCKLAVVAAVLLSVSLAAAQRESVEQLQERAERAKPSEQVKLYLDLADRQLREADQAFSIGEVERGNQLVDKITLACDKAVAAAHASNHHQKLAEIHMRNLERRLEAIRRNLSYDDRDVVAHAIERLEKARSQLLSDMFGVTT